MWSIWANNLNFFAGVDLKTMEWPLSKSALFRIFVFCLFLQCLVYGITTNAAVQGGLGRQWNCHLAKVCSFGFLVFAFFVQNTGLQLKMFCRGGLEDNGMAT